VSRQAEAPPPKTHHAAPRHHRQPADGDGAGGPELLGEDERPGHDENEQCPRLGSRRLAEDVAVAFVEYETTLRGTATRDGERGRTRDHGHDPEQLHQHPHPGARLETRRPGVEEDGHGSERRRQRTGEAGQRQPLEGRRRDLRRVRIRGEPERTERLDDRDRADRDRDQHRDSEEEVRYGAPLVIGVLYLEYSKPYIT
jgi:hypothetical protein